MENKKIINEDIKETAFTFGIISFVFLILQPVIAIFLSAVGIYRGINEANKLYIAMNACVFITSVYLIMSMLLR